MSDELGAGASALDAGVSIDGAEPVMPEPVVPEPTADEVALEAARDRMLAEDAVARARAKVATQEYHLDNARAALALAEAALTELER